MLPGPRIAFLLLAAALAWGAASPAAAEHPDLYFGADQVADIRARAADSTDTGYGWSFADVFATTVTAADGAREQPFTYSVDIPDRDGSGSVPWSYSLSTTIPPPHPNNPSYPPWTAVTRGLQARMEVAAVAYVVTGDAGYLSNASGTGAVDTALKVAAWSTWTDPGYSCAHSCLDTAHLTLGVSLVYDVAYQTLSEAQRNALRAALVGKGIAPLAIDVAAGNAAATADSVPSNLHALRTAALAIGAAAVAGEVADAEAKLTLAHQATRRFFDLQGAEGGSFEGHVYGAYAANYLVIGAFALSRRGRGDDLLDHPWLASLPRFAAAFLASDLRSTANFGDSTAGAIYWTTAMFARAAAGDRQAQWYLTATGTTRPAGLVPTLWARPDLEPEPISGSGSAVFTDIGHAALRAGFAGAPVVAVKSGPTRVQVGHNHFDHNSFIVNAHGEWIAADPGYRSYFDPARRTYTTGTIGHNTIMVDKSVSADGASASGGQASLIGGELSYFFDGAGYAKVVASAAAAYPAGLLSRFGRRVLYAKPDLVWVFDDLAAPAPHAFSFLLHTVAGGSFAAGDDPAELVASGFRARLEVTSVASEPWESGYPRAASHPGAEVYGPYGEWRTRRASAVRIATALVPGPLVHGVLDNPGFEDGLASWTPRRTDGSHAVDSAVSHGGGASARIAVAPGEDSGYFYSEPLTVAPAGSARASAWVRAAPGTSGTVSMRLHWMRNGAYLPAAGTPVEIDAPSDWTSIELAPAAAPTGADALRIDLAFTGTGTVWFDDARAEVDNLPAPRPVRTVPLGSPAIGLVVEGDFGTEAAASRVGAAQSTGEVRIEPTAAVDLVSSIDTDASLFAVGLTPDGQLRRAFVQGGSHLAVSSVEMVRAAGAASFDLAVERGDDCARLTLTEVETLASPPYRVRARPDAVFIGATRVPFAMRGDMVEFPSGDDLGRGCELVDDDQPEEPDEPETSGGCGCRAAGATGSLAPVALLLIVILGRRRRATR